MAKINIPRVFLSTLSLRRATSQASQGRQVHGYFYPRSPCGERPLMAVLRTAITNFYPRSPCGERQRTKDRQKVFLLFLSTLSLRRATFRIGSHCGLHSDFYPRSPCGERPVNLGVNNVITVFLSTLSLRRATIGKDTRRSSYIFLSTLSLRRATAKVHKTVGHFCAYETNFMGIASSC